MDKTTISFRIDAKKKRALDALAAALDRDRTYILNEAVAAYLEVQQWQLEQIKEGLRQAEAGEFARDEDVAKAFKKWRS
jgi:predicted transcriptional regulator